MSLTGEIESPKAILRYPDAKVFSELISTLAEIMDEALFVITDEGVKVRGMDPAKVSYIEVLVPREAFLDYNLEDEVVEMGINLDLLERIAKAKKGNPIEFRISSDKVLVTIETLSVKRYLLPNIEVSLSIPEDVKLEHKARALLISDAFKRAISDVESVADLVELRASEEQLVISSVTEDKSRATARFTRETSALLNLEVEEESASKYDVSYISRVAGIARVADTVELGFSTEKPLELKMKSPDGSLVRYLLAPTV